jgi:integrase
VYGAGFSGVGGLLLRARGSVSWQRARPEYATRHFQALAQHSGLPAIRLHDLRHTNASLALEAGMEMEVVSDRLGHSQISVTADLYAHVSRSLDNAAAEQIAGVLRAPSETVPPASLPQAPKIDPSEGGEADVQP